MVRVSASLPPQIRSSTERRKGPSAPQLEVLRSPYFLSLLVDQLEAEQRMPTGRAALFTGFIRQALRREVERENPLFGPGPLLTATTPSLPVMRPQVSAM